MMELTAAQQVFAIFSAIFFGVMLQTAGAKTGVKSLNLFDTPNAWSSHSIWRNKPLNRFILSVFFLNILPGLVFAVIFSGLHALVELNWLQIVIIVFISLFPTHIYRLYFGVLTGFKNNLFDRSLTKDKNALKILGSERSREHSKWFNHVAIPVFLILPVDILFYHYYLVATQLPIYLVIYAWLLLIFGVAAFLIGF
ncbi:MAG: hypothetical protein ACD_32C00046G0003 [uncultured bacterium]|nr:MAG: hypothetical protein ACD_32C00046G0003 [uncultured bacterium]